MSDNSGSGLLLVGGMVVGMFMGWYLGSGSGKDDGIEWSLRIVAECQSDTSESEDQTVEGCFRSVVENAREEKYADAAAQQYP